MAVWIDPAIEFIVREAHQDMGTFYTKEKGEGQLTVVPLLTEETKLMALVWNEGEIKTLYTMEQQGVYVSVMFEPQILGYQKRQVGRALYDFENALIGAVINSRSAEHPDRLDRVQGNNPAHHNVGGHPIREADMRQIYIQQEEGLINLEDIYKPLTQNRPGDRSDPNSDGLWWPTHIVQKVTVEGGSIKYDPIEKFWRGRLSIHAHIANAGFGEL